jgi:hypothetical protein
MDLGMNICHKTDQVLTKKMTKNVKIFLPCHLYHRAVVKKSQYVTHRLSYTNTVL